MSLQAGRGSRTETHTAARRVAFEKALRQGQNIATPFAQGRQMQGEHVEPVIQVFAEAAGANFLLQDTIAGRQHANVQGNERAAT